LKLFNYLFFVYLVFSLSLSLSLNLSKSLCLCLSFPHVARARGAKGDARRKLQERKSVFASRLSPPLF